MCFSIKQAVIYRRVLINAVYSHGKFKLNANSNDRLELQKIDGSTLYDSLELSFNTVDKTSISKLSTIDILAFLKLESFGCKCIHNTRHT